MLFETLSGNDLDLKVGPMTQVEMVFVAESTRSVSTRIFGRFGATEARIPTTSSGLAAEPKSFSVEFSKPIGLVVNIAVSSLRKRSCLLLEIWPSQVLLLDSLPTLDASYVAPQS